MSAQSRAAEVLVKQDQPLSSWISDKESVSPSIITLYVMEIYRFTHSAVLSVYSYVYNKTALQNKRMINQVFWMWRL